MSVYNPQIPQSFLQELENMSTDIRQQKKDIAAAKAEAVAARSTANTALVTGQTAQSAADAAATALQVVSGTVQTISAEMVRKFTSTPIAATSFVLDAVRGYYYATISHMLGDAAPDIEVYDADKDKQRIQSIILDNNTIELELDADDMATNSFPFTCIVLGKNTPVLTGVGLGGEPVPGRTELVRFNAAVSNGTIEYSMDNGANWIQPVGLTDVGQAYLADDGTIFYYVPDGESHYKMIPGQWTTLASDAGMFASVASDPGSVLL